MQREGWVTSSIELIFTGFSASLMPCSHLKVIAFLFFSRSNTRSTWKASQRRSKDLPSRQMRKRKTLRKSRRKVLKSKGYLSAYQFFLSATMITCVGLAQCQPVSDAHHCVTSTYILCPSLSSVHLLLDNFLTHRFYSSGIIVTQLCPVSDHLQST